MKPMSRIVVGSLLTLLSLAVDARASVIAIGPGDFPATSPLLTFVGLADGTEVNGLIVGGVQFAYTLGNGAVVIDGGPGTTNNVTQPNIVSIGNNTGTLRLLLPALADRIGFGYAILNTIAVPNAATVAVFNGVNPLGTLSYAGTPDPGFTGGFAGLSSTLPFDRVDITFNSTLAPAFAVDNIRFTPVTVPEPSLLLLLAGSGVAAVIRGRRRPRDDAQ